MPEGASVPLRLFHEGQVILVLMEITLGHLELPRVASVWVSGVAFLSDSRKRRRKLVFSHDFRTQRLIIDVIDGVPCLSQSSPIILSRDRSKQSSEMMDQTE